MNSRATEQLPEIYTAIDPAIAEIIVARNHMTVQVAKLDCEVAEFTQSRMHKQEVTLAMTAEDLARTAFQIRELALAIHRSIARRLDLEVRI